MSSTIKTFQNVSADVARKELEQLSSRGGLYYKGHDMAAKLHDMISNNQPYYPPIFPTSYEQDDGAVRGFLDYYNVDELKDLPQAEFLAPYVGSVMLLDVNRTSELRPHELGIIGTHLPAVRVVFRHHGQETGIF